MKPHVFITKADELDEQREDHELAVRKLLFQRGWEYTCDVPGSLWLYLKKLPNGRVVMVGQSTAVAIERAIAGGEP